MKTRSLTDLFVRGKILTLDDGEGPEDVWIQKLNPVEHSEILRAANAARARAIAGQNDPNSEFFNTVTGQVLATDREDKVEALVATERAKLFPMVEEEMSLKEEWSNDDYLTGLRDSWRNDLRVKFETDPEDEEAKKVHEELDRYVKIVLEETDKKVEDYRHQVKTMQDTELDEIATKLNFKLLGDAAWLTEYRYAEIAQAVRNPEDHKQKLLTRVEVNMLQDEILDALATGLANLNVEPLEGKGLEGTPPSSASSE